MKIKGVHIEGPQERTVVLPRQNGNDLVFKFKAILSMDDFEKICPVPEPKERLLPGGIKSYDIESKEYQERLNTWAMQKTRYMYLKSIAATPDLEWETVDLSNPDTWGNYEEELIQAGLTEAERLVLLRAYSQVQGLDQSKIDDATNSFLAVPQVAPKE